MQVLSLIWGILAILGMVVGFFPCFGALNWLNIPFAGIGLIVSSIAMATGDDKPQGGSIAGLICCIVALVLGAIRLTIGWGIF